MSRLHSSTTYLSLLLVILAVSTAILAIERFRPHNTPPRTYPGMLTIGEAIIGIEISRSEAARQRGLSSRDSLPYNAGMLFIFDAPGTHSFWMKDMRFHIDIIWLDSKGTVVGTEERMSPRSYPKTFTPPFPIKYALEVNTGFVRTHNIKPGMLASFTGSLGL